MEWGKAQKPYHFDLRTATLKVTVRVTVNITILTNAVGLTITA